MAGLDEVFAEYEGYAAGKKRGLNAAASGLDGALEEYADYGSSRGDEPAPPAHSLPARDPLQVIPKPIVPALPNVADLGFFGASKQRRADLDAVDATLSPRSFVSATPQPEGNIVNALKGMAVNTGVGLDKARLNAQSWMSDVLDLVAGRQPTAEGQVLQQSRMREYEQAGARAAAAKPEYNLGFTNDLYDATTSLAQTAPSLGLAIATKNPALGLGMAGMQSADYLKYKGRGATVGEASLGAAGEGAVEIITEKSPMGFLLDKYGTKSAKDFLSGYLIREGLGEQAATLAQDAIDTAVANPNKTWAEYLKERPNAAYQTALATLVMGGAVAAPKAVAEVFGAENQPQTPSKGGDAVPQSGGLDAAMSEFSQYDPDATIDPMNPQQSPQAVIETARPQFGAVVEAADPDPQVFRSARDVRSELPHGVIETPAPRALIETARGATDGLPGQDVAEVAPRGGEAGGNITPERLPADVVQQPGNGMDTVAGEPGAGTVAGDALADEQLRGLTEGLIRQMRDAKQLDLDHTLRRAIDRIKAGGTQEKPAYFTKLAKEFERRGDAKTAGMLNNVASTLKAAQKAIPKPTQQKPPKTMQTGVQTADEFSESSRKQFLRIVKQMGGITVDEARDITGEPAHIANRMLPGFFNARGNALDLVSRRLHEAGYLTDAEYNDVDGGVQAARDLIGQALAKEFVGTPEQQQTLAELEAREADVAAEMQDQAERDALAEILGEDVTEAEFTALFEGVPADETQDREDIARAQEQENDAAETARIESQAGEAVAGGPSAGNEGRAGVDGRAAVQGQDAGQEARPALDLSQQTEQELADRETAVRQREAEVAKREAEAAAKDKADRERGDFALTGSGRAADANPAQRDLLAAPNDEARNDSPVAESQAPDSASGDAGVAPGRAAVSPQPKEPWQMTRREWEAARESVRPNVVQSDFTRASASGAVANARGLERLLYGVTSEASEKLKAAQRGEIELSPEDLDAITERLQMPVSHEDVVRKAVADGMDVPDSVLEEYPDIAAGETLFSRTTNTRWAEDGLTRYIDKSAEQDQSQFSRVGADHMFALGIAEPAGNAGPVSQVELDAVIERVASGWKRAQGDGGRLIAVDTVSDLPAAILRAADAQNVPQQEIKGVFHKGHIYLVRENHASAQEVEETIFHEAYGHMGALLLNGNDRQKLHAAFNDVWSRIGALDGVRKMARQFDVLDQVEPYIKSLDTAKDMTLETKRRVIVDELLAHVAGRGDFTLKEQAKAYIGALRVALRNAARAMKLDGIAQTLDGYTDSELLWNLKQMRAAVVSGKTGKGGGTLFHRVFHGTPHAWAPEPGFPHGRPRLDKMGSGEGAQAYGWGWYSAESQKVAQGYKSALSYKDAVRQFRTELPDDADFGEVMELVEQGDVSPQKSRVLRALQADDWLGFDYPSQAITAAFRDIEGFSPSPELRDAVAEYGNLYQLDIPDSATPYLLDWDKPLSKQTPEVRAALEGAPFELGGGDWTGQQVYDAAAAYAYEGADRSGKRDPKGGSELLASLGIVGNRYLDGDSRNAGEGTYNYVIWDQPTLDRIAMLERNGKTLDAQPMFSRRVPAGPNSPQQSLGLGSAQRFNLDPETRVEAVQRVHQDKMNRWAKVQRQIKEQGGTVELDQDVYHAMERMTGRAADRIDQFTHETVRPLLKRVANMKTNLDELGTYLMALAAKDRNAKIQARRQDMPGNGSGMTDAEAAQIIVDYQTRPDFAKFDALARDFQKITERKLKVGVLGGLMTQQRANELMREEPMYVPLKGFETIDEEGNRTGGTGAGYSTPKRFTKQAFGRVSKAGQVVENIIRDYEQAVILAEKANVGRYARNLAQANPDPTLWTVDLPPQQPSLVNGHVQMRQATFDNENEIRFIDNGQEVRIQLHDPLLVGAYNNLGQDNLMAMMKVGDQVNRVLRQTYTQKNPAFILVNGLRDIMTGLTVATGEMGVTAAVKSLRHAAGAWKAFTAESLKRGSAKGEWAKYLDAYRKSGAQTAYYAVDDIEAKQTKLDQLLSREGGMGLIEAWKKGGLKRAGKIAFWRSYNNQFVDLIESLNGGFENMMRLAAFRQYIDDHGGLNGASRETLAEASRIAKNLTVNFNRKGEATRNMNSLYLFWNANVQGTQNLWRAAMQSQHKGQVRAILGGMVGVGMMMAFMSDDEDEDLTPDYVKDTSLTFYVGDSRIQIPLAYGLGYFVSLGRNIGNLLLDRQTPTRTGMNIAGAALQHFSPFGNPIHDGNIEGKDVLVAMTPTLLKPPVMTAANRNQLGYDVVPKFSDAQPDRPAMYNATRGGGFDMAAGGLEKAGLDMSPETLKLWTTFVTGGLGTFVVDTVGATAGATRGEFDPEKTPILKRFYGVNDVEEHRSRFYELAEDVKQQATEQGKKQREFFGNNKAADSVQDFTKQMKALREKEYTANQAGRPVERIHREQIKLADVFKKEHDRMVKKGLIERR